MDLEISRPTIDSSFPPLTGHNRALDNYTAFSYDFSFSSIVRMKFLNSLLLRDDIRGQFQQCYLSRFFHLDRTEPEMNLPWEIFDEFALGKSFLPR